MFRRALSLQVEGPEPPEGGCVLVANHSSFLDPLMLGLSMGRRRITFMMTEVVYRSPSLRWFYRLNRVIPLSVHGANRGALRAARAVLQRGEMLGIFPEGGISRDGRLLLGNPGAVSLVLSESVPVVPIGIRGAYEALPNHRGFRRHPVRICRGDAIDHDSLIGAATHRKQRLQLATRRIMDEIAGQLGQVSREAQLEAPRHV